jgi:integrase
VLHFLWSGRTPFRPLSFSKDHSVGRRLGFKVWPHGLRHAAITEALDLTGGNVRAVQRFSRHRDVRVLERYDDNRKDLGGEVAKQVAASVPGDTSAP